MISSQNKPLTDTNQEDQLMTWKEWKPSHPELDRSAYSTAILNDMVIILNGTQKIEDADEYTEQAMNIALLDPKDQSLKIIPSTGDDINQLCWRYATACYWKDSKIIVCGGVDVNGTPMTSVGIITIKDLDSDNPSAHWEQVHPNSELHRSGHFAHIYQDKMYVTGYGSLEPNEIWFLDLVTYEWKECSFTGDLPKRQLALQYAASQNKIYAISSDNLIITPHEYDLDTLTCKTLKSSELIQSQQYVICHQAIDGKIYGLFTRKIIQQNILISQMKPKIELWAYDLDLGEWTQIKVSNPLFHWATELLLCGDQLVLTDGFEINIWSLPIDVQKSSNIPPEPAANLSKVQQTMKQFLKEAPYSDISFEVESETIPAHKWWLTKRSKYFANMFSSGMIEAQSSKIAITDMTASAFKAFLEFLYSDHVQLNYTLALELLQQADKYSVGDLKAACETYLAASITPENFVKVGQVAELVDALSLREAIVSYISKNIKKLKERKDFEQISDHLLRDSVVKFVVK